MTIFDLINACGSHWDVIRIFADEKDLGSYFKFAEIPEALLKEEVDTWTYNRYHDNGETVEIDIFI